MLQGDNQQGGRVRIKLKFKEVIFLFFPLKYMNVKTMKIKQKRKEKRGFLGDGSRKIISKEYCFLLLYHYIRVTVTSKK